MEIHGTLPICSSPSWESQGKTEERGVYPVSAIVSVQSRFTDTKLRSPVKSGHGQAMSQNFLGEVPLKKEFSEHLLYHRFLVANVALAQQHFDSDAAANLPGALGTL